MMTAAPSRFASYGLSKSSVEKPTQNMAPSFTNNPWQSDATIWGSKNVIGSAYTSQREAPSSRGSDDASPTAPSGSAQLNHQSEAETPAWAPRNGIWNKQDSMTHGRAGSGSASPNTTRDGGLVQHGLPNSQFFARQALGQNGTPTFSSRTKSNGTLEKYPPVFGTMGDDVENGSPYPPMPSKYTLDNATSFKRGSQDQGFPALGHIRDNGSISTSRPTEFSVQTTPGSLNPDLSQFPFDSAMSANPRGSLSRPVPNHTISFPANGHTHRGLSVSLGVDRELSGLMAETLRLNDGIESDATGLPTNGYLNPASQPFQFNPSSQNWSGELPTNGRGFGQVFAQHDSYADQASNPYPDLKRASIDRGSPSAASFHRAGLASPRFTPGPGRGDSWPGSRPISRNHALAQEFERHQQQFSQNPNFYPNGQYYGNNFSSQYSSPVQPYEIYSQNTGFRNQVQLPSYGMANGYMLPLNAPVRPSRDQDPGKGVRSVLLEEFRGSNRSNKRFELRDIYGHVVEFSGDQHGSRFIQEKLQTANSDEKDQVFKEIEPNAVQLMKDVFGNYVIQKFFEHGSLVQKIVLARHMKGKVAELSTQMYACRVVQKALEHVLVDQQEALVEELKPDMIRIVRDQNGNHVIQKIISLVPRMCVPFMMSTFRGQINSLSAHNYGCRVVQRMLEQGTEEEKREVMEEVHACAPQLITDTYGNYVAQHVVEHGSPEDRARVIQLVIDQLIEFSVHKFASNVVEKCVEFGTEEERMVIKTKLVMVDSKGNHPLDRVMIDQYGNYVLQKVVGRLGGDDKAELLKEIKQRFNILKRNVSGRQISAIERLLGSHEQELDGGSANSTQSTAATPPGLHIDVSSVAPTPALTTEHNSPESASPPSTNLGDDTIGEGGKAGAIVPVGGQPQVVEAYEDEK